MITLPAATQVALETDGAPMIHLLTIEQREGTIRRFVLSGEDITIGADTFVKDAMVQMSAITNDVDNGARVDFGLVSHATSVIKPADVSGNRYLSAAITIEIADRSNAVATRATVFTGRVSNINDSESGLVTMEAKGISSFSSNFGSRKIGIRCPYLFGDKEECQVPVRPDDVLRNTTYALGDRVRVNQTGYQNRAFLCTTSGVTAGTEPTYNFTVAQTTSDGTAVFTAEESYTRQGTVASVTTNSSFTVTVTESRKTDEWFTGGAILMTSGANAGIAREIRLYTAASDRVELWEAFPAAVAISDAFEIHPGCDHTFSGGCTTFANTPRYGGINFNIKDFVSLQ